MVLGDPSRLQHPCPEFEPQQTVTIKTNHPDFPTQRAKILTVPTSPNEPHTIQLPSTGHITEVKPSDLTPLPTDHQVNTILKLPWIQPNTKVTILLPSKTKTPKQGWLIKSNTGTWSFQPGCKDPKNNKHPTIQLPNFKETALDLFHAKQLVKG